MAKFFRRGITKVHFLPAIADLDAGATSGEIAAGTNVTARLAAMPGWTSANQPIDTPDMDERFTSNIPGEDRPEQCALTYDEDDTTAVYRTLFTEGLDGYIAIWPKGKAATKPVEYWPIRVSAANRSYDTGNTPARETFQFAITRAPNKDAVTPA